MFRRTRLRDPVQYHDGISYDARFNSARGGRCVVKVPRAGAKVGVLTDFFTFTGDNRSKYRAANGLLIPSATNTPRIEYDAAGNCLGLLVEGARTNLALWSEDGTNAAWVKSNMTTAQTSTGPDGAANSATRLTASAGNATILQTVTSASATRAYSVWLRRITGTGNIDLTVDNGSTWTTKTLTTLWARYDISQAAVTNPVFGVRIVTSGDAIDFYGAQLESAAFPSSYVPTTTGSVARDADLASRTFGSEYSTTAGTAFAEWDCYSTPTNNGIFSNDTNGRFLYFTSSGGNTVRIFDGTTAVAGGVAVVGAMTKAASSFDASGMAISLSGAAVVTGAYDGSFGTASSVVLGATVAAGTSPLFGHIRRLDYYPSRLSNAFLRRITSLAGVRV